MFVLQEVMDVLLLNGARQAQAGEFTLRAFLNKKLDLSQAEAVADIIDSEAKAAHQSAIRHIRGDFSKRLGELREKLISLSALIELELDFVEEDVEFADKDELTKLLNEIKEEVNSLAGSFKLGNVIKKGVSVVIAGKPNAGKSTLLNCLLQEERAITSAIPGTTRDYIEDTINIDGVLFRFADTAGLTEGVDVIEKEGIKKTREKIDKADILIYLFDMEKMKAAEIHTEINELKLNIPCLFAANKVDKISLSEIDQMKIAFRSQLDPIVFISSKYHENIEGLKAELISLLKLDQLHGDQTLITNVRHFNILRSVIKNIHDVQDGLDKKLSGELIALDLRHVIELLGEITGTVSNQDVLNEIFNRFCIGK
jgi:tRNA modification GTPase